MKFEPRGRGRLPGQRRRISFYWPWALACLLVLASPGRANSNPVVEAAPAGEALEALVAQVAQHVEAIRGLEFLRPVPVRRVRAAALRQYAERRIDHLYGRERLEHEAEVYRVLGLWPAAVDLREELLELLEHQVGAFYAPETGEFYVMEAAPRAMLPIIVAHELTHALEDQHYDLDARLKAALHDTDRSFALSAVQEGSATILMTVYLVRAAAAGELGAEDLAGLTASPAGDLEQLQRAPELLRRELLAPYLLGMGFLARGDPGRALLGFPREEVDRCYRDPPQTSEQVLHPQKYWDPDLRDLPEAVELGEAGRALGRRWRRVASGVLGELFLGVLAGAPTPADPANLAQLADASQWSNTASAGWDGDRWELWRRGRKRAVLLASVWDSEKDAQEFAAAVEARGLSAARCGRRVALVAGDRRERHPRVLEAMLAPCAAPELSAGAAR